MKTGSLKEIAKSYGEHNDSVEVMLQAYVDQATVLVIIPDEDPASQESSYWRDPVPVDQMG